MTKTSTLYLVRGYPGSGRTSAVEELRLMVPGLVFVDADPQLKGHAYSDLEAHAKSIRRATDDIRQLVRHKTPAIAVETCAARTVTVNQLLAESRAAGYRIKVVAPLGEDPDDLLLCYARSKHEPETNFVRYLATQWEEFELDPVVEEVEPPIAEKNARREAAWAAFTKAMAAPTRKQAEDLMDSVQAQYPEEVVDLQLFDGPTWGRSVPFHKVPVYPLATICPYWANIQKARQKAHAEEITANRAMEKSAVMADIRRLIRG